MEEPSSRCEYFYTLAKAGVEYRCTTVEWPPLSLQVDPVIIAQIDRLWRVCTRDAENRVKRSDFIWIFYIVSGLSPTLLTLLWGLAVNKAGNLCHQKFTSVIWVWLQAMFRDEPMLASDVLGHLQRALSRWHDMGRDYTPDVIWPEPVESAAAYQALFQALPAAALLQPLKCHPTTMLHPPPRKREAKTPKRPEATTVKPEPPEPSPPPPPPPPPPADESEPVLEENVSHPNPATPGVRSVFLPAAGASAAAVSSTLTFSLDVAARILPQYPAKRPVLRRGITPLVEKPHQPSDSPARGGGGVSKGTKRLWLTYPLRIGNAASVATAIPSQEGCAGGGVSSAPQRMGPSVMIQDRAKRSLTRTCHVHTATAGGSGGQGTAASLRHSLDVLTECFPGSFSLLDLKSDSRVGD